MIKAHMITILTESARIKNIILSHPSSCARYLCPLYYFSDPFQMQQALSKPSSEYRRIVVRRKTANGYHKERQCITCSISTLEWDAKCSWPVKLLYLSLTAFNSRKNAVLIPL